MPAISVVIPAYNAEKTIAETIESVLSQTFSDFEIIVVDNGSTDETRKIVESISDERIKVAVLEQNVGPVGARNHGILCAEGEFIALLDSDDIWTSNKLELQYKKFQSNPRVGLVYCWTNFMYGEAGQYTYRPARAVSYEGDVYRHLLEGDFIYSPSNVLVRRAAIDDVGLLNPDLSGCDDWEYWTRLARRWHFAVVRQRCFLYRKTSTAMSSDAIKMSEISLRAIEAVFQAAPPEYQHIQKRCLAARDLYCANLYLSNFSSPTDIEAATSHIKSAIKHHPLLLSKIGVVKLATKLILMRLSLSHGFQTP